MSANVVVADAGPLHYLILIDCVEILAQLFDRVLIPCAVRDELIHPRAPKKVKDWILHPPSWLEIMTVANPQLGCVGFTKVRLKRFSLRWKKTLPVY